MEHFRPLFLYFFLFISLQWKMLYKNCRWQDSNHGVGSDHSANWAHNPCPTKNSPTHFLKNILFPASFFFIFVFSMQLTVNKCSQTSRINGFEPRTSSVGSQLVHQKLPPPPCATGNQKHWFVIPPYFCNSFLPPAGKTAPVQRCTRGNNGKLWQRRQQLG